MRDRTQHTGQAPWLDLTLGLVPLAAVSGATCWLLGLPTSHLTLVGALYAFLAALVLLNLPGLSRGPGIGPANRITLGRSVLVLPVAALVVRPEALTDRGLWWIIALATVAMILDGMDGRVARRTGTSSAFGARFDVELDAVLLLALSALVWLSGKVGAWVFAIGGMRYLFVLSGAVWPALTRELPRSLRRSAVCVVQGVAVLICLGPIVPSAQATQLAAAALLLLVWSFAVDIVWLLARARA